MQERTNPIRKAKERIDVTLELVGDMCKQFDLMHQANAKLLKGPSDDLKGYVDAMDQLRNVLGFFSSRRSLVNSEEVFNIKSLLAKAIQQLEDDFQSNLLSNSKSMEPDHLSLHLANCLVGIVWKPHTVNNPETLPLLHGLAIQLFHAGHQQQCLNIYSYQSTLEQILKEYETGEETGAYLQAVTKRILQALQSTLERKSKQYDDPALGSLFLMNNFQQMVKSLRNSELKGLLGDDWIQRRRKIVQLNANEYRRSAWKNVCLANFGML